MIRIMTGRLIEVGNGTKQPESVMQILESKVRENAGYTVPAQGLILKKYFIKKFCTIFFFRKIVEIVSKNLKSKIKSSTINL